jgi:hypothetical protein
VETPTAKAKINEKPRQKATVGLVIALKKKKLLRIITTTSKDKNNRASTADRSINGLFTSQRNGLNSDTTTACGASFIMEVKVPSNSPKE